MIANEKMNSIKGSSLRAIKKTARIAGILYLLVMIHGMFSLLYVSPQLIVPGDALTTAKNIRASEFLFRIGSVSELLHMVWYFILTLALYLLLKPVSKNLAYLFVLFALVAVPIAVLSTLNNFAALSLLSGANYLKVFTTDQLQAQALFFLNLNEQGYFISQIFMGFWMLILGYLVSKSSYLPRILGVLFIIGGFGLLIESFQYFLFPGYQVLTYPGVVVSIIAEISFCFWLLAKGTKGENDEYER
ncbi:MAG: DUF4386 domain-containing protein [Anaerolineales bacterium]|nr:DUF4386 domain-containing protein [Anaerolineales bacterium]